MKVLVIVDLIVHLQVFSPLQVLVDVFSFVSAGLLCKSAKKLLSNILDSDKNEPPGVVTSYQKNFTALNDRLTVLVLVVSVR